MEEGTIEGSAGEDSDKEDEAARPPSKSKGTFRRQLALIDFLQANKSSQTMKFIIKEVQ